MLPEFLTKPRRKSIKHSDHEKKITGLYKIQGKNKMTTIFSDNTLYSHNQKHQATKTAGKIAR